MYLLGQIWTPFLVVAILGLCHVQDVESIIATCGEPTPMGKIEIKETSPAGTVLFNLSSGTGLTWDIKVVWPPKIKSYLETFFMTIVEKNTWTLRLIKPLDLEMIFDEEKFLAIDEVFKLQLICRKRYDVEVYHRELTILPVNEFPPIFLPGKPVLEVPEELPVGAFVKDLNVVVTDIDAQPPRTWETRFFTLNPMTISVKYDGGKAFAVTPHGQLIMIGQIDFEAGQTLYLLNLTVEESSGFKTTGIIRIIVLNINDSPPVFVYLNCMINCYERHYKTSVTSCHVGPVLLFSIGPINAIDPDGEDVTYKVVHASPSDALSYLEIDKTLGSLYVKRTMNDVAQSIVILAIQASDSGTLRRSDGYFHPRSSYTNMLIHVVQNC